MPKQLPVPSSPKQALQIWAKQRNLTPTQFAKDTKYSYAYAWSILSGEADITLETLGRIVVAYGSDSVISVIKAFKSTQPNTEQQAEAA